MFVFILLTDVAVGEDFVEVFLKVLALNWKAYEDPKFKCLKLLIKEFSRVQLQVAKVSLKIHYSQIINDRSLGAL